MQVYKVLVWLCLHWYIGLRLGSIPTWDDMVGIFCNKYFHREEDVTLANLQGTKQKSEKDILEYIKRFKNIALEYYDHYEEKH